MRPTPAAALAAALLLGLAVLVAGCGPGSGPGPDASFSGAEATIEAVNVQFEPVTVTLPAGQPLRLILDNKDAGVPHDLHVFRGEQEVGRSPTIIGPGLTEVRFGPLTPGNYQFQCEIHPDMIGTLAVTP